MRSLHRSEFGFRAFLALYLLFFAAAAVYAEHDPLPSWNSGPAKKAILAFVKETTEKSSPKYVQPVDRIATFDQDGTFWTEHPLYGQAMFALERLGQLAPQHPEWKEKLPFQAVLERDHEAMGKFTEHDWMEIVAATHAGMSSEEFQALVKHWIATAKAPRFDRPYTDLIYQPMLEVMKYLREKGFRTYIVTGGGQEFVRVYSEQVYGVPPEQVVGSSNATKYEMVGGKPVLMREPKVFFIDDGPGKAIGINLFIGKRPQAAFGNSGGDQRISNFAPSPDCVHSNICWFITTTQRVNMRTVLVEVCQILTLALSPMRFSHKPRAAAGSLSAGRTTGSVYSSLKSEPRF